jgi:hypothetical protein
VSDSFGENLKEVFQESAGPVMNESRRKLQLHWSFIMAQNGFITE